MPVRRRDYGLPEPEAVGQRARGHLRLVEIGRDVDVAHRDEAEQRLAVDELVEKDDVVLDAELAHALLQAVAIGLALLAEEMWMRRAQDHVDGVGPASQDRGHRIDHDLDALVGRQQAEGQDDRAAGESEPGLGLVRLDEGKIGNAVGDDLDLVGRKPVDRAQHVAALFGHHDDTGRGIDDPLHDCALRRVRLRQDGVERRHDRHRQARQEPGKVRPGLAAEDAELVLQRHHVETAVIQEVGSAGIVLKPIVADLKTDGAWIVVAVTIVIHRDDGGFQIRFRCGDRLLQVRGEGRDAAVARQRVADEGDTVGRVQGRASIREIGETAGAASSRRRRDAALGGVTASFAARGRSRSLLGTAAA